jgi:hypothetical protein
VIVRNNEGRTAKDYKPVDLDQKELSEYILKLTQGPNLIKVVGLASNSRTTVIETPRGRQLTHVNATLSLNEPGRFDLPTSAAI